MGGEGVNVMKTKLVKVHPSLPASPHLEPQKPHPFFVVLVFCILVVCAWVHDVLCVNCSQCTHENPSPMQGVLIHIDPPLGV